MLREMAREADQLVGERDGLPDRRICRIEAGLADVIVGQAVAIAPHRLGQRRGDVLGQAQNLADFADGAARAVMHDGGADRRAMAAVAPVDVLDHLLAPLMLEIDVDIGRLAAVLGNEAGEQEIALVRIDRGDAEAKAHRAVGRRAAALAEDFLVLPAREGDDVVDGEEVARIIELGDEREFVVKPLSDVVGNAFRISVFADNVRCAPAQVRSSRCCWAVLPAGTGSSGYSYFSSPSEKRQASAISMVRAMASGKSREQPRHLRRRFEMPFGIDGEPQARFGERAFLAHAGEHVGERPALRRVIENVIDGDERRIDAGRRVRPEGRAGAARRRDDNARRRGRCGPARRAPRRISGR